MRIKLYQFKPSLAAFLSLCTLIFTTNNFNGFGIISAPLPDPSSDPTAIVAPPPLPVQAPGSSPSPSSAAPAASSTAGTATANPTIPASKQILPTTPGTAAAVTNPSATSGSPSTTLTSATGTAPASGATPAGTASASSTGTSTTTGTTSAATAPAAGTAAAAVSSTTMADPNSGTPPPGGDDTTAVAPADAVHNIRNGWQREFPDPTDPTKVKGSGDWVNYDNGKEVKRIGWGWENPADSGSGYWVLKDNTGQEIDRQQRYKLSQDQPGVFIGEQFGPGINPQQSAQAQLASTILFPIVAGGALIALGLFCAVRMSGGSMRNKFKAANEATLALLANKGEPAIAAMKPFLSTAPGREEDINDQVYRALKKRLPFKVNKEGKVTEPGDIDFERAMNLMKGIRTKIALATGPLGDSDPTSEAIVKRQYLTGQLAKETSELTILLHKHNGQGSNFSQDLLGAFGMAKSGDSTETVTKAIKNISEFADRMGGQESFSVEAGLSHFPGYNKSAYQSTYTSVPESPVANFVEEQEVFQRRDNGGVTNQALEMANKLVRKSTAHVTNIAAICNPTRQPNPLTSLSDEISKRSSANPNDPQIKLLQAHFEFYHNMSLIASEIQAVDKPSVEDEEDPEVQERKNAVIKASLLSQMNDQLKALPATALPVSIKISGLPALQGFIDAAKTTLQSREFNAAFKVVDADVNGLEAGADIVSGSTQVLNEDQKKLLTKVNASKNKVTVALAVPIDDKLILRASETDDTAQNSKASKLSKSKKPDESSLAEAAGDGPELIDEPSKIASSRARPELTYIPPGSGIAQIPPGPLIDVINQHIAARLAAVQQEQAAAAVAAKAAANAAEEAAQTKAMQKELLSTQLVAAKLDLQAKAKATQPVVAPRAGAAARPPREEDVEEDDDEAVKAARALIERAQARKMH